jgi:Xaa-Pro aminopeptidase
MDHPNRIARVAVRLEELGVDALLVTDLTNVRYLTGFSGSNGQLLITPNDAIFFSDGRYAARAASLVTGAEIEIYSSRLTASLGPRLASLGIVTVGVEAATMTLAESDDLAARLGGIVLTSTTGVVEDERRSKDDSEVALIREAVRLADQTFAWLTEQLAPGRAERTIALDLEVFMRQSGAEDVSFDPIVGSGPLSAHIHHTPSERVLETGDLVLLDLGAVVDGYCSDLTRTVVLGPATPEQKAVYDLALEAQGAGIAAVKAGGHGRAIDRHAREVIEAAGRGAEFGHGLGHGVGLDIHEAPRLHRISEDVLRAGDVVTVEPGVYRQGWGGVRIEDCVLVTETGCEVLGKAPKDGLIEI